MNYIYLDTCSINFLHDNLLEKEIAKWKKINERKLCGKIVISPISLYEILGNKNSSRKDDLIHTCQLLYDDFILPPLISILSDYLEKGCPICEVCSFNLNAESPLNTSWIETANDFDRTIYVNNYSDTYLYSSALYHLIKNDKINSNEKNSDKVFSLLYGVNEAYKILAQNLPGERTIHEKVCFFFLFTIILMDILPFERQNEFWEKRNISCMQEKIEYIFNNCTELLYHGPIACMSQMAICQVSHLSEKSRGMYNDCLHLGYLPYSKMFISNDKHFRAVSNYLPDFLSNKIVYLGSKKSRKN